jgi:hypothetical protein
MNTQADEQELLEQLEDGALIRFRDWDPRTERLSEKGAGVYTIWNREGDLMYVGVGGRPSARAPQGRGLFGRLKAHASGVRSGDQFCVYVADRLVLPELSRQEIVDISERESSFDKKVREFIHEHLGFRWGTSRDFRAAIATEESIKAGILRAGPPRLNPSTRPPTAETSDR